MYAVEEGEVLEGLEEREEREVLLVKVGDVEEKAINYPSLTGPAREGDLLLLNTTAVRLNLGSGGYHFVITNLSSREQSLKGRGHIMKLRYTPQQLKVHPLEEQMPHLFSLSSLEGLPVVVLPLHSHLSPLTMALEEWGPRDLKITCIMTSGGALPLYFSDTIVDLRKKGLIESTITCGQAFGGDWEAINIYTALLAAKKVCGADVVLVSMGPGHVGTKSQLGFSGAEMAGVLDAISLLEGESFFVPRLSFADGRSRHTGLSHHTITILAHLTRSRTNVILPTLSKEKRRLIEDALFETEILERHGVIFTPKKDIHQLMEKYGETFTSMGRGVKDDEEFFQAPLLTGYHVGEILRGRES